MSLLDRAKSLFENIGKRRELSSSAVSHDRVDDGVLDDFRQRAPKFDTTFNNSPMVPTGTPPAKCPNCGTDAPDWQAQGDQMVCSGCSKPVAMPESPYSPWSELVADAWRAYYTYDEPRSLGESEVKPSHELNRRVMSRIINSDEFLETRPITRLNEFESAFSSMSLTSSLEESLREGALAQHAARAQEMAQYEDDLDNVERKLEQLREAIEKQNGQPTPDQDQEFQELAANHSQTAGMLAQLAQAQANSPIGIDVGGVVDAAVQEAQQDANLIASMPGSGMGSGGRVSPDMMFALAQQWKENEILRRVAELMGRLERDMRYKRANRVVGGFEEVVDVELGDSVHLALPHELAKLKHPLLRLDFKRRFHEKAIAQYELRGNEPEGKGPVVVLVDGSGSMSGDRNAWARAVSLALVNIAHKERRDAACVEFGSSDEQKAWFYPGRQALDIEAILDFASHFFGGGTDINAAVALGRKIMTDVPEFNKADLVIVTDGNDYFDKQSQELKDALHGAGVRIHGIGIGGTYGYLQQMAESAIHVSDLSLDGANDATDALATQIT